MTIDVTYIHPEPVPVIEVLEDAVDCDEVIVIGRKGSSLYVTQSRANMFETMATLDLVREFLGDLMINTSGTWH